MIKTYLRALRLSFCFFTAPLAVLTASTAAAGQEQNFTKSAASTFGDAPAFRLESLPTPGGTELQIGNFAPRSTLSSSETPVADGKDETSALAGFPSTKLSQEASQAYGPSDPENDKSDLAEWDRRLVAQGKQPPQRGWSKTLARAEIAYQVLQVVDSAQTFECMSRPTCHENNPILGKHPSKLAIVGFTAVTGWLHYKVIRAISKTDRDLAKAVAFTLLAGQGLVVGLNFKELY